MSSTITRTQFQKALSIGTPEQLLKHAAQKAAGRPDRDLILSRLEIILSQVDVNDSGLIGDNTTEAQKLWKLIDDFDKNGNSASVTAGKGTAHELAWALMADTGLPRIAQTARNIVESPEAACWGQEPGDLAPIYNGTYNGGGASAAGNMKTPTFLDGSWKCSVFVGEMMFRSGFTPPYSSYVAGTPKMPKRHYEMACEWHKHTKYYNGQSPVLSSVKSLEDVQPGDVITFQRWGGSKWNVVGDGGHVMVVVGKEGDKVQLAEASSSKAQFVDFGERLRREYNFSSSYDAPTLLAETQKQTDSYGTFFEMAESVRVRFLRPIQKY